MAVSALAVAGMFSAQALADGNKTGFYVTGKAGTSVVSLSDQRFIDGEGVWADRYKGGDDHDTVFSGGIAAGYDFTHSSVSRFVRNWSFMLAEKLTQNTIFIKMTGRMMI